MKANGHKVDFAVFNVFFNPQQCNILNAPPCN